MYAIRSYYGKGVLIGFLNRFSIYRLTHGTAWAKGCKSSLVEARWFTCRELTRLFTEVAGRKPRTAASVLPGPPLTWRESWCWRMVNRPLYPACLGAFAAVRFDLVGDRPLTPLMAFRTEPNPQG